MQANSENQGGAGRDSEDSRVATIDRTSVMHREGLVVDLMDPKDQALVRSYVSRNKRRWRMVDDHVKDEFTATLAKSANVARNLMECESLAAQAEGAKLAASVVKTLTVMEGQNQTDELKAREEERADSGKVHQRIEVVFGDKMGL